MDGAERGQIFEMLLTRAVNHMRHDLPAQHLILIDALIENREYGVGPDWLRSVMEAYELRGNDATPAAIREAAIREAADLMDSRRWLRSRFRPSLRAERAREAGWRLTTH